MNQRATDEEVKHQIVILWTGSTRCSVSLSKWLTIRLWMQWLELKQTLRSGVCCRNRQTNRGVLARLAANKELPYNMRKLPPDEGMMTTSQMMTTIV
jgi:hypothetical protein